MPKHLPLKILITGLAQTIFKALSLWFHYTLVAIAWLIVVPLSAYRIYKFIFNTTNGLSSILTLPGSLITPENFASDVFYGVFIVLTSVAAFVALVWLREQIINGVAPEWMELNLARRPAAGQAFVNPVVVDVRTSFSIPYYFRLNKCRRYFESFTGPSLWNFILIFSCMIFPILKSCGSLYVLISKAKDMIGTKLTFFQTGHSEIGLFCL